MEAIKAQLKELADPADAQFLQGYFRTGPGQYGEGDRFLGIRVPVLRKIARGFKDLPIDGIVELLADPYHEVRMVAVLIMVHQAGRGRAEEMYHLYLRHTHRINNWDLVDVSAPHIVGSYLYQRDHGPLYELARFSSLWERRISIIATQYFIKQGHYKTTLEISQLLLNDENDLIHKAVGWMLREVGKRDRSLLEDFLGEHYRGMPRTMLRYAIEKFPEDLRQAYLHGRV
ncbi:MAG: DNA alkylation repair protein [Limnochordia bacterium]